LRTVDLPFPLRAGTSPGEEAAPRLDGRVLVVDDSEPKRYLVAHALRMVGMEVHEAATGHAALEAMSLQPDVVVLDVRLPDLSGFEVCRRLKEDPATASVPVLYVSALMQDSELERHLFQDGADGYIPQPIEPKHLVAQTWALVRMHRAEQARVKEREAAQFEREHLQRALAYSQDRMRRLAQSGVVGVITWDLAGPILDANDTFLEMVGYTQEELAWGRLDWKALTPAEWVAQDERDLEVLRERGIGRMQEKQLLRKDGTRVDVMVGGALLEEDPSRGVSLVVDITAQRQAERRSAQLVEALRDSEQRLRLALEAASLGTWGYVPSTGLLEWDARTRELFGVPPEAPVDYGTWQRGLHPEDRGWVEALVRRVLAGEEGGEYSVEHRVLGQDGRLRWVYSRGRAFFGEDGRVRHLSGTLLDITGRKQSEARAADFQATTAAFSHALTPAQVAEAMVARGLRAVDAYAGAVCRVAGSELEVLSETGYPAEGVRAYARMPLTLSAPLTDAARTGQPVWVESREELEQRWPGVAAALMRGSSRAWGALPLKDGERVVGVLGLSFTAPRTFSPEGVAHLEALCGLCGQALERARQYEESRGRESTERQFLGMVSHDLRNPLQAISLAAGSLRRAQAPSPELVQRLTGRIAVSADTMGRMVSDLLDFTRERLGGGISLERAPGDLVVLCREVIDEFRVTHPSRELRFEPDAPCEGAWDEGRMRQVVSNLVSNALRHASVGTPVWVRVRAVAGEAELSVSNEGEPISPELLPVLFEPFRRGMAEFRPSGSLGLGLYIVRQVVEGHSGRVEVATGRAGTTFTVRVPVA
jgi:PAS domain S-box-containing protein